MKKIITLSVFVLLFSMILVSAGQVHQGDLTWDEFKSLISNANRDGTFAVTTGSWEACERDCPLIGNPLDCNPCGSSEVAEFCGWHPDSMATAYPWSSGSSYCSDYLRPYDYFNKQCYCSIPTVECSGGGQEGDRKCTNDNVFECLDTGSWDYVKSCDYGCTNGACDGSNCQSHDSKKCYQGNVYWYDSCGDKEDISDDCENDETCSNGACKTICTAEYVGEKFCSGNSVYQKKRFVDCTEEDEKILDCTTEQTCLNGVCIDKNCPVCDTPSDWTSCVNGKTNRVNFKCDASTSFTCSQFNEEVNCDCSNDEECEQIEFCEDRVCKDVECEGDQIADGHQCVDKVDYSFMILTVILPVALGIILIIVLIFFAFKKRKRK